MARGDPDPQCRGPDGELQWRNKLDCLAIDAGMHSRWGLDLQVRSAPSAPPRVLPPFWCVEHQDPQFAAGERRSGGETRRIRIVGHQQHGKPRASSCASPMQPPGSRVDGLRLFNRRRPTS
jgi:hypothetical protein